MEKVIGFKADFLSRFRCMASFSRNQMYKFRRKYLGLSSKHKSHGSDANYALAVCSMKSRTCICAVTYFLLKLWNYDCSYGSP